MMLKTHLKKWKVKTLEKRKVVSNNDQHSQTTVFSDYMDGYMYYH